MVSQTTLRSRLLALATGAGLAAGLLGVTGAQAEQYQVGELEIFLDTTVSLGASLRTASRMNEFLPSGNGGPQDTRPLLTGGLCDTIAFIGSGGAVCDPLALSFIYNGALGGPATATVADTDFAHNFDGTINGDDGRLNWDRGDLIGAAAKVTHDLEVGLKLANRLAFLLGGRIIFEGDKKDLEVSKDERLIQFLKGSSGGPIKEMEV